MKTMKRYLELSELEQYKVKNHIGNLFALSSVDGKFSKSEAEAILKICERYGIERQEINEMIKEGSSTKTYVIPSDTYEKLEQIYDFVTLILADGTIDTKELELCKEITRVLKIEQKNINNLILTMVDYVKENKEFFAIKSSLYSLINE